MTICLSFIYNIIFQNKQIDLLYIRFVIRAINLLSPTYFFFTGQFTKNKLSKNNNKQNNRTIVSLTSFPARIDKTWLTIESLLRQNRKPDAILLWLYDGEFNGESSLPKNLLKLRKRGLEIRFCSENLKPHKKYFYTMLEYPEDNVITVDDDFFYPPDLIENLHKFHKMYPSAICCPITRRIKVTNGKIAPYKEWDYIKINTAPNKLNLTMGGGPPLFPSNSLHPDTFDIANLKKMALCADDLWLKIMSLRKKTDVISIAGEYRRFFIPVIHKSRINLMTANIHEGGNDKIFRKLLAHYKVHLT